MTAAWEDSYNDYLRQKSPETLNKVVTSLAPSINYSLAQFNATNDPVIRSHALLFAADAVESYDPKFGTALPTHVSSQLRQLSRTARQARSPVKVPDRIQLDAFKLKQAEARFRDDNGRDPDVLELADASMLSPKRIGKVRTYQVSVPSESAVGDLTEQGPDYDTEALEAIHHNADHTDRRILEMKTGYGGTPVLSPKDIAIRLNLTPVQLTRRSARLTARINAHRQALETI